MTHTELELTNLSFVRLAHETVLRSLAVALLCALAAWLFRSKTASLRFLIWKWALLALFALPFLAYVIPPLSKTSQAMSRVELTVVRNAPAIFDAKDLTVSSSRSPTQPASKSFVWTAVVPIFYLLSTLVLLAPLAYNLTRLRRLAHRSESIPDLKVRSLCHEIWLKSGAFVKPRVAVCGDVVSPVTFDAGDTWILLPASWQDWNEAKLRAVLTHEMAHVQRGDAHTLLLASLAKCLFWFHPLSWFLRRQLSVLAEEACDEIVVATETAPERYANFLIDFASDLKRSHGRLVAGSIAVVGRSSLKHRIERLFANQIYLQHRRKALAMIAFALILPALYITAAARPYTAQDQQTSQQSRGRLWPQATTLSPADAAKIESALQANPEDLDLRMELLMYYSIHGQEEPFTTQMLWLIKHHPSAEALIFSQVMFRPERQLSDGSRAQIAAAWAEAMTQHANSPAVLYNAAGFFEGIDPERSIALLREAEILDPGGRERYDRPIALIYAAAELRVFRQGMLVNNIQMSSETGAKLREQLESSRDPALLAETGRELVQLAHAQNGNPQFDRGIELIQQAINLDPSNTKWTEALEWAEAEPQRQANYQQLMKPGPPQLGAVRIGSKVAEANLISKTDPVYPAAAREARIQGVVEFTVTVGPDGKVQELTLVHGHPMLAHAAMEAVTKYVYHPAVIDGNPVPFVTEVLVPFRLDPL